MFASLVLLLPLTSYPLSPRPSHLLSPLPSHIPPWGCVYMCLFYIQIYPALLPPLPPSSARPPQQVVYAYGGLIDTSAWISVKIFPLFLCIAAFLTPVESVLRLLVKIE